MNVFIDLDGTIIDCRRRLYGLFSKLAPKCDISFDRYWSFKREARSHAWILRNLRGWEKDRIHAFEKAWLSLIETKPVLRLDFVPAGNVEALTRLGLDRNLYLVTARRCVEALNDQLESLDLARHFGGVLVPQHGKSKAATVLAHHILITKNDFVVGDTEDDIHMARELGISSVALTGGFRSEEYLRKYTPNCIYSDLRSFVAHGFDVSS